ncbi:helix-turn-helix transcriptional regulator [Olsenella uli]|uniref:helix-turn-helix domain-containing protein n=1 Tax=Olsenella uli TaxID=133926 RepID=UPI001958F241|nr:helix-turn-helix transcriptional regulator [Olsenella uli]MBM6676857.1 helix-turn-helix transcriptional regulator [Olsenella uli]
MELRSDNVPDFRDHATRLGYRLRDLRRERGLSQETVAHRAGLALYTYQKFEKGESKPGTPMNPTYHTLLSLAWVFDLDVSELLDLDGSGRRTPGRPGPQG